MYSHASAMWQSSCRFEHNSLSNLYFSTLRTHTFHIRNGIRFCLQRNFYWIENSQNWKKKTQNIRAIQPKSSYFVNVPSINFQLILLTYLQFSQSKSIIVARCLKPRTQHFVWEWNEILCFFFSDINVIIGAIQVLHRIDWFKKKIPKRSSMKRDEKRVCNHTIIHWLLLQFLHHYLALFSFTNALLSTAGKKTPFFRLRMDGRI